MSQETNHREEARNGLMRYFHKIAIIGKYLKKRIFYRGGKKNGK